MNIIFDNVIVLNTYSRFLLLFYLHRLIFGASSLAFCVILPWNNIYILLLRRRHLSTHLLLLPLALQPDSSMARQWV